MIYKTLTSKNPQAAHNIMQYSFKERRFIMNSETAHIVYHYGAESNLILTYIPQSEKDIKNGTPAQQTDEFREQEEYLENKKKFDNNLLETINKKFRESGIKLPCKCNRCYLFEFSQRK